MEILLERYLNPCHKSDVEYAESLINKFNTEKVNVSDDGVVRWVSNDQIPPKDILELWNYAGLDFDYAKTIEAKNKDDKEFFEKYRESMKNYVMSDEEKYEMENAFGKGTVVVDVITGQKFNI